MADYKELWQSLNIDLEKHDQLCEVLPKFYSEIYLSQENRPKGMDYFNMVVSEIHGLRIQELDNHRKQGNKVMGSFCVFVPDELALAANVINVGLCAGSDFWHPDGEKYVPQNTCPLVKAAVGAKMGNTCPYFNSCDLLVGETTCDSKKKAWEILGKETDMYVIDLPQMKREKDYASFSDELKSFKEKLEDLSGNEITADKVRESIELVNEKRKALKRLYDLRKNEVLPISGKDALLISQIAFYDDPKRFIKMTNELCDELDQRVSNNESVFAKDAKRILVSGTPMAVPNWKLHHVIESSGGAVVCEETCTGSRYFENYVSNEGNTLEEQYKNLANRYMGINCACFTPNNGRVDDIIRLYKEHKADGVVYFTLPFCQTYSTEYKLVKERLDKEGIPVTMIETGYSLEDAGQLKTRLEAFFEVLENR
ncbi:double-cubane-cluster-containing anaerobic reductase [Peptostreptococcaceae bacterium AGR-M142]